MANFTEPDSIWSKMISMNPEINESRDSLNPERVHDEKEFLLDLLHKNQKLTQEAQQSFSKEKREMIDHFGSTERQLRAEIESLKSENRQLKVQVKKSGGEMQTVLLEELSKLEERSKDREAEMSEEIDTLRQKEKELSTQIDIKDAKLLSLQQAFEKEVHSSHAQHHAERNSLLMQIRDLKENHEKGTNTLKDRIRELEKAKQENDGKITAIIQVKESGQEQWANEKNQLQSLYVALMNENKQKEKEAAEELAELKAEKEAMQQFYTAKISKLGAETDSLTDQMERMTKNFKEKELKYVNELEKLRNSYSKLFETSQERANLLEATVEKLKGTVDNFKEQLDQREASYLQEAFQNTVHMRELHELLEQKQAIIEKFTGDSILKAELKTAQRQLVDKESQLNNMREMYLSAKHSDRISISRTIASSNKILEEITKQHSFFIKDHETYREALKILENSVKSNELEKASEILSLTEEVQQLLSRISELEEMEKQDLVNKLTVQIRGYEEEIQKLRKDNLSYKKNLNELENTLQSKLIKSEPTFEHKDQIQRYKLASERLAEENANLVETRLKMEEYYLKELTVLHSQLKAKEDELSRTQARLNTYRVAAMKKDQKDLALWAKRQQAFQNTITTLETQIRTLSSQAGQEAKLVATLSKLESEELRLLRVEVKEKEEWVSGMRAAWEAEKNEFIRDIDRLNGVILSFKSQHDEILENVKHENKIANEHRKKLGELYLERLHEFETSNSMLEKDTKYEFENQQILENCNSEMLELAREEIEQLKRQIKELTGSQSLELSNLRQTSEAEITRLKKLEEALSLHISSQQRTIDTLNARIVQQKQKPIEAPPRITNRILTSAQSQPQDKVPPSLS